MRAGREEGTEFDQTAITEKSEYGFQARPLVVTMTVGVFMLGSILGYQILVHPGVSTISIRGDGLPLSAVLPTSTADADPAAGMLIATERCSGCHAKQGRLVGPSWQTIFARYDPTKDGKAIETCLPKLIFAVGHPEPGLDGYPQGPRLALSLDERQSLAAYILDKRSRDTSAKGNP